MSSRNTRADGVVENGPGAQSGPQDALGVAASSELYRLLLYICPPRFRQRYGAEMAQVFHDYCREAWGEGERRGERALLALCAAGPGSDGDQRVAEGEHQHVRTEWNTRRRARQSRRRSVVQQHFCGYCACDRKRELEQRASHRVSPLRWA